MADESSVLHNWEKVIIPVGEYMEPMLCAICRNCRAIYTEGLHYGFQTVYGQHRSVKGKAMLSQSGLPRLGCKPDGLGI